MTTHYRFIAHLGQQLHLRQDVLGEGELLRGMMMKMMVIEGPDAQVRPGTPGGQRRAQARGAEPAANNWKPMCALRPEVRTGTPSIKAPASKTPSIKEATLRRAAISEDGHAERHTSDKGAVIGVSAWQSRVWSKREHESSHRRKENGKANKRNENARPQCERRTHDLRWHERAWRNTER